MHRGAVVGFRCVPDLDLCFCVAEKISYQREIPVLATLDGWLQHIVGQKRLSLEEKFMVTVEPELHKAVVMHALYHPREHEHRVSALS